MNLEDVKRAISNCGRIKINQESKLVDEEKRTTTTYEIYRYENILNIEIIHYECDDFVNIFPVYNDCRFGQIRIEHSQLSDFEKFIDDKNEEISLSKFKKDFEIK